MTEQLKAENQMEWVRKMNGISNRAIEHIKTKILYPAFDNYKRLFFHKR